jgi:hypothetical protein
MAGEWVTLGVCVGRAHQPQLNPMLSTDHCPGELYRKPYQAYQVLHIVSLCSLLVMCARC